MEFVVWSEKYSTGNPLVDAYHHLFFEMVQEFREAIQKDERVDVEARVGFLVDYIFMHFDSEERLMEKGGYRDLESHRELHQAFRERVAALAARLDAEEASLPADEVLFLMQDWFAHHILGADLGFKGRLDA